MQNETILLSLWGRVTHIFVGDVTITGSDNGLSPGRLQAIIWTNAGVIFEIRKFSFKKMHMKISSVERQPFCLGLNVLMCYTVIVFMSGEASVSTRFCSCHAFDSAAIHPCIIQCSSLVRS